MKIQPNIHRNIPNNRVDFSKKPAETADLDSLQPKKKGGSKLPIAISTAIGTLIPMLVIGRYQGKFFKPEVLRGLGFFDKAKTVLKSIDINYGLNEMLLISVGSILGGLSGGLLFDKGHDKESSRKSKIKESVFQFLNIAVPTTIVAKLLKVSEKAKSSRQIPLKIASVIGGVGVGMPLAAIIANKVNGTFVDKDAPKRKLRIKDIFVHVDDLVSTLVLLKLPIVHKLNLEKAIPVLYGMCGWEAGTKK